MPSFQTSPGQPADEFIYVADDDHAEDEAENDTDDTDADGSAAGEEE